MLLEVGSIVYGKVAKDLNATERPELAGSLSVLGRITLEVNTLNYLLSHLLSIIEGNSVKNNSLYNLLLVDARLNECISCFSTFTVLPLRLIVFIYKSIKQSRLTVIIKLRVKREGHLINLILLKVKVIVLLYSDSLDTLIDTLLCVYLVSGILPLTVLASILDCIVEPTHEVVILKTGNRRTSLKLTDSVPETQHKTRDIKILSMLVAGILSKAVTVDHNLNYVTTLFCVVNAFLNLKALSPAFIIFKCYVVHTSLTP